MRCFLLKSPRSAKASAAGKLAVLAAIIGIAGCASYDAQPLPQRPNLQVSLADLDATIPAAADNGASRQIDTARPLSICGRPHGICGRPHGKRFLRVERFGRLRSYVRPFGAAHTSAGLDEVRRTGSLSLERALCSCSASGCSRHSVTTVSSITFRCACQTRSSGPLACSDGGLFLMPLRTSRRESIRQFSSSPRRSGPAYWPRPP